jgi:hypothetical protein
LNRVHLAAEPLLALVGLRGRLHDFLRAEISGWRRQPVHASLFGSGARGDGDTRSDLDLLVVRPDHGRHDDWEDQFYSSGQRILAATGNQVSWLVTTPADIARAVQAAEPIVAEWRRDAVHLVGRRLEPLLRGAA